MRLESFKQQWLMQKTECGHMLADDAQMRNLLQHNPSLSCADISLGQIRHASPQDDTMRHSQADHQLSTPVTGSSQKSTGASMRDLCTLKPTAWH